MGAPLTFELEKADLLKQIYSSGQFCMQARWLGTGEGQSMERVSKRLVSV